MRIILATHNAGKIAELQSILSEFECIPQQQLGIQDIEETGHSFIENAILKARHASHLANQPALADDSGLVVNALNGEPGIFSARFAGEHATSEQNINLLLERLAHVPPGERRAYFYCAIAWVRHAKDPTPLIATGQCFGEISQAALGDQGFGYDPIFYLPEHQCTFAQLPAKIKNTISHRAHALNALRAQRVPFFRG